MHKSLLCAYEVRQKALVLENAELKKVLQQMKKEMIHILSPRQPSAKGTTADEEQVSELYTSSHKEVLLRVRRREHDG